MFGGACVYLFLRLFAGSRWSLYSFEVFADPCGGLRKSLCPGPHAISDGAVSFSNVPYVFVLVVEMPHFCENISPRKGPFNPEKFVPSQLAAEIQQVIGAHFEKLVGPADFFPSFCQPSFGAIASFDCAIACKRSRKERKMDIVDQSNVNLPPRSFTSEWITRAARASTSSSAST